MMLLGRISVIRMRLGQCGSLCIPRNINRPYERQKSAVENLVSEYGHEQTFQKLLKTHVSLEHKNPNIWKEFITIFEKRGFKIKDCFQIIFSNPSALDLSRQQLEDVLTAWVKSCKLDTKLLIFLLINRPEFLNVRTLDIEERIPHLLSYCVDKDSLVILLLLCPNLLQENWTEILSKMTFLGEEMVVYRTEILQSKALSKSLEHIKLRFAVLDKCGLYIKPSPYEHKQTKLERMNLKNPHLRQITDTSNAVFARKVAKITLEEYEVFADTFNMNDSSSDDDSDELDQQ